MSPTIGYAVTGALAAWVEFQATGDDLAYSELAESMITLERAVSGAIDRAVDRDQPECQCYVLYEAPHHHHEQETA